MTLLYTLLTSLTKRPNILRGHIGLGIECEKDEDAEGGSNDVHNDVPHERGQPVGHWLYS